MDIDPTIQVVSERTGQHTKQKSVVLIQDDIYFWGQNSYILAAQSGMSYEFQKHWNTKQINNLSIENTTITDMVITSAKYVSLKK